MAFISKQKAFIASLNAECGVYEHRATGCQVIHIKNDDPENLFAYMFRTPPHDSTGLPHILEHTVLCGSRRFPLKDPFAQLAKTSLNTFINAITYPDRTLYPASSSVPKDLFNIMKVYGDAVFFPLLRKEMFRQEGVGIQFDKNQQAQFQGVVYNEMKGVYSNRDAIANRACRESLFETGPYAHDSGGDPAAIPFLSYDSFIDFHRRYYHPSNACVFLYGNIETEEYLHFLEHTVLSSFVRGQATKLSYTTPRRNRAKLCEVQYPVQGGEQRHSVIKNWLLSGTEAHEIDMAQLVSELLVGNTSSPLYRAMIESGLGQAVSATTGVMIDLYEPIFTAGLDEVDASDFDAVIACIDAALLDIREKGFDVEHVDSIFAHTEIQDREVRGGSAEGLHLMQKVACAWVYNADVIPILETNKRIAALRDTVLQRPQILQDWITEHLIENTHTGIVHCKADPQKIQKDAEEEQSRLETMLRDRGGEFEEDRRALFALQNTSESKRNLAKLPKLQRSDVPTDIHRYDTIQQKDPCWAIHQHLFTNRMNYLHIGFDATGIPLRLLLHLPILSAVFTECGTKSHTPEVLSRLIDRHSTGIYTSISCDMHAQTQVLCPYFFIKTGFLAEEVDHVLHLLQELLFGLDIQQHDRILETMQEMITGFTSSLIQRGHLHSMYRANRFLSPVAHLEEQWHSLTQFHHLQRYCKDMHLLEKELAELQKMLFTKDRLRLSGAHEAKDEHHTQQLIDQITKDLPVEKAGIKESVFKHSVQFEQVEAIETSSQVSFNALALQGVSHKDPLYAASLVLSQLLNTDYLWEHVRMRNGAYGAFAMSKGVECVFSFVSYRDPQIDTTFAAFSESLGYYARTLLDTQEIDLALFGLLGSELRTIPPYRAVGMAFHYALHGISDNFRQYVRDCILKVTPQELQSVAARLQENVKKANHAIVSGTKQLDASSLQNIVRSALPVYTS